MIQQLFFLTNEQAYIKIERGEGCTILFLLQSSSRKSALLSAAKKAKLKSNPSRVRFAESVDINGSPLFIVSISSIYRFLCRSSRPRSLIAPLRNFALRFLVGPFKQPADIGPAYLMHPGILQRFVRRTNYNDINDHSNRPIQVG